MQKTFPLIIIILLFSSCGFDSRMRLDVSVHESSRMDTPMPAIVRDYMQIGKQAVTKQEYQTAFLNFHAFWAQNPEDIYGPLFCGQSNLTVQEYQRALYYYREAASISCDDPRIAWGILLSSRAIFEKYFISSEPVPASEKESEEILDVWKNFKTALNETIWPDIAKYLELLDFVSSIGAIANNEKDLEQRLKDYTGFLVSSPCVIYLNLLQPRFVRTNGKFAELQLISLDHMAPEIVYFKHTEQGWVITNLLRNLYTCPENLLSYQNKEELETPIPYPLDVAKITLIEKIKAIWDWQEPYRREKAEVPEDVKKVLSILDQAKSRITRIFEGRFGDNVHKKLHAMIHNSIERLQDHESIYTDFSIGPLFSAWNRSKREILESLKNLTTYGIPKEIWEKCSYQLQGIWILDMSTTTWENLSDADQKIYAKSYRDEYARSLHKSVSETYTIESVSFPMELIPPGRFWMGSLPDEPGRKNDERRYRVIISMPFYIGKYEVTQAQWQRIMNYNPAYFQGNLQFPVEQVSWYDCIRFCNKVFLRLPSEAEWEYACRSGITAPFNLGSRITTFQINYNGNYPYTGCEPGLYRQHTTVVGTLPNGNSWGCYDFHGNVWEWCYDWYGDYALTEQINPTGGSTELQRVSRGGGWSIYASSCRSADRSKNEPGFRYIYLGLRVARSME